MPISEVSHILPAIFISVHLLTDISFTVLEQAINAFGDLAGGGHDRFGSAAARLDAAIKGAQGILGVMTALAGQAKGAGGTILPAADTSAFDLASRSLMLRAQP
jgi:hypothetical protein